MRATPWVWRCIMSVCTSSRATVAALASAIPAVHSRLCANCVSAFVETRVMLFMTSPIPHRAVTQAGDGQISAFIGVFRGQFFVNLHPQTRHLVHHQKTILVAIVVRENFVGEWRVRHQLLNAKVGYPQAKIHSSGHTDGRKVCGTVKTGSDLVHGSKVSDAPHMGNATGMHNGRAD